MAEHRVLVIGDDAGARDALGGLVPDDGLRVRTAATGRSALACAEDFGPETVFCDFSLRDGNGFPVLRAP